MIFFGHSYDIQEWDLEAGDYWLIGMVGALAEESQKITFCIGSLCEQEHFINEEKESSEEDTETEQKRGGCSVVQKSSGGFWMVMGVMILFYRRR